jgi:hypothetical protein
MKVEEWRASPQATNYRIPSSSWCGMTCLRMMLLLEGRRAPSLDDLFEHACAAGVFTWEENGWKGANLHKLPAFIGEYGFMARLAQTMDPDDVAHALAERNYVFPRVGPDIRYRTDEEPSKNHGHFVFMYGYETDEAGNLKFLIHNSAGFASLDSQIAVPIPAARLRQVFSGDAILVRSQRA